jgi:hypothetical protein
LKGGAARVAGGRWRSAAQDKAGGWPAKDSGCSLDLSALQGADRCKTPPCNRESWPATFASHSLGGLARESGPSGALSAALFCSVCTSYCYCVCIWKGGTMAMIRSIALFVISAGAGAWGVARRPSDWRVCRATGETPGLARPPFDRVSLMRLLLDGSLFSRGSLAPLSIPPSTTVPGSSSG